MPDNHVNRYVRSHAVYVEGSLKNALDVSRNRMLFVGVLIALSFSAVGIRLFDLGIDGLRTESRHLDTLMDGAVTKVARRNIVDRNGVVLATNLNIRSLYADPKIIMDVHKAAEGLHRIFPDMSYEKLTELLTQDRSWVWIKRNLHPDQQYAVNSLGMPGLKFEDTEKRTYPHGRLLSHVIGRVNLDGTGISGVESYFDHILGWKQSTEDDNLQLTIDIRVQQIVYEELKKQYDKHSAIGGAALVMDVHSGEMLSLVSLPDFDPNVEIKLSQEQEFNNATLGQYEMGSTFKIITAAMGFEMGLVNMNTVFDATESLRVYGHRIADYKAQKRPLLLPEVIKYSSNIGTAKLAEMIGAERQREFLDKMGMLERLEFEISERGAPLLPPQWGPSETMTIGFGHGLNVSLMHVARAYSAITNGGLLKRITFTKKDSYPYGEQVISKATSEKVKKLMRLVVTEGSGKKADAKGYFVGGKTGTAEKKKKGAKGYDRRRLVSSFAGVFPMHDPKYVVIAMLDEPKGTKDTWNYATAGWVAAPAVGGIVSRIGPLLGVKPVVGEAAEKVDEKLYIEFPRKEKK